MGEAKGHEIRRVLHGRCDICCLLPSKNYRITAACGEYDLFCHAMTGIGERIVGK